jgi:NAD(P)-dependent dehydrogenase (short-subunit alcohol dehydrogenase family)
MDNTATGLLAGKIALITGAGRSIGAAAARLFAAEGACGLLAARTETQLKAVTEQIRAAGGTAEHVVCDLADPDAVRAAIDHTVATYGRLDIAFNNAATNTPPGPLDQVTETDFDHLYSVNLKGTWVAMVAEIAAIRATAGTAAIVNNSSVGSLIGNAIAPRPDRTTHRGHPAAPNPPRSPRPPRGCCPTGPLSSRVLFCRSTAVRDCEPERLASLVTEATVLYVPVVRWRDMEVG